MKEDKSRIITLLPKNLAKVGYTFYYIKSAECEGCTHKQSCISKLRKGRKYRVISLINSGRKDKLLCFLTGDEMEVVTVELATITINLYSRAVSQGVIVKYTPLYCHNKNCVERSRCQPKGIFSGDKILVKKLISSIPCPLGYPLFSAEVLPLPP